MSTVKRVGFFIITMAILIALLAGCSNISSNPKGTAEYPSIWNNQSAYAYAQALGYEGTLEEFIEKISGSDGMGIDEKHIRRR